MVSESGVWLEGRAQVLGHGRHLHGQDALGDQLAGVESGMATPSTRSLWGSTSSAVIP